MERKIVSSVTAAAVTVGVVLLLGACAPSANDEGGFSGEGHGGNPSVKAKLDDAKKIAPRVLRDLTDEQVASVDNPEVREFLKRRFTWANDIESSSHDWPTTEEAERDRLSHYPPHLRERAAVTNPRMASDIRFSWTVAEKVVLSLDEAVDVLLHESAHHLAQTDEAFVKLAVAEVMRLWKRTRQPDEMALRGPLCDRLGDYYLLFTDPERETFLNICNTVLRLRINQVQKVPPYDAVSSVDVSFEFVTSMEERNPFDPGRDFHMQGISNLTRVENPTDDGWRVGQLSVHSKEIRDELNEFFRILDEKPATVSDLLRRNNPRVRVLPEADQPPFLIYDSAFPRPLDEAQPSPVVKAFPVLNQGSQLIVYVTSTGKWWPLAYTPGGNFKYTFSQFSLIQMGSRPIYTTARLAAPFMDREPGAEHMPFHTARYKPEMLTVNWNHLAFLGPGPFNLRPFSSAGMTIEEAQVQDALRKLRMAPILLPELDEFESLAKDVEKKLISMKNSIVAQPILKAELREIHAQYFLRRARVRKGDGVLAFLNYIGSDKNILRYGLTQLELRFLVLRALSTYLKTAHNIPAARRLVAFEENLELLGWRLETFEISRRDVSSVVTEDSNLALRFYFYDQAQAMMKEWRETVGEDESVEWLLRNYLAELERELGLKASEVAITGSSIDDTVRVASLIEAYKILKDELLPKMQKSFEPTPADVAALAYSAVRFREAIGRTFYTAEYLYVGRDPFPNRVPPNNDGTWIESENSPYSQKRYVNGLARNTLPSNDLQPDAARIGPEPVAWPDPHVLDKYAKNKTGSGLEMGAQVGTEIDFLTKQYNHYLQSRDYSREDLAVGNSPRLFAP
ncbi:MAG: hypothetical protein KDD39_08870 [Bdellovibrionales bacterium]|nr:hypothetical protein [Bdellovibrionales bacterium]